MRLALPALAGALFLTSPAHAQFSQGYKFLEAVRKKDAQTVTDMVNSPGSTIINTRDLTTGETALHIATARRDLTWMGFLAGKGANVNLKDGHGVTPLELASNLGFVEGVELLVQSGARVDEPNSSGETALMAAVHRRDLGMIRLLLKAGADPDRSDNSGRTARDYALLDGKTSPMVTEIQTNARPRGSRGTTGKKYGPSL
ncbi:MAG: ankyrin repeat domain-containing protein [Novosphingobium sp.]|nr:ankyrin repeat domain-containing protein [Novosphingobium sp.]